MVSGPGVRIKTMLRRGVSGALDALLPAACVLCGGEAQDDGLCAGCRADLPWLHDACKVCAEPLAAAALCGRCSRQPPPFDRVRTALRYERPVSDLVTRFKFGGDLAAGRALGILLARHLGSGASPPVEALIPVPLHRRRLGGRGFNQAALLARDVARRLRRPRLAPGLLVRTTATDPQAELPAASRRGNVRGAFRVRGTPPPAVALVDDVVTTASTVSECARQLRRAGAEYIEVWAVARAPRDSL